MSPPPSPSPSLSLSSHVFAIPAGSTDAARKLAGIDEALWWKPEELPATPYMVNEDGDAMEDSKSLVGSDGGSEVMSKGEMSMG